MGFARELELVVGRLHIYRLKEVFARIDHSSRAAAVEGTGNSQLEEDRPRDNSQHEPRSAAAGEPYLCIHLHRADGVEELHSLDNLSAGMGGVESRGQEGVVDIHNRNEDPWAEDNVYNHMEGTLLEQVDSLVVAEYGR